MIPLLIGAVIVVGLVVGTAHAASKAKTGKKDSGPQTSSPTERERKSDNVDEANTHGNEQKETTEISERNGSTTGKSSSVQVNGGTANERRTPSVTSDTDAPTQDQKVMGVTTANDVPVPDVRRAPPQVGNRGKERKFAVSRHEAHTPKSFTIPMKPPVQEKRTPSKLSRDHVSPKERTPALTAEKEPVSTQDKLTSSIHRKKSKDKAPPQAAVWESLNSDLISREILEWQNEGSTGQDPEPMLAGSAIDITDEVHVDSAVPETPSNATTVLPAAAQAKPTGITVAENPPIPVVHESVPTPPETMSNTQTVAYRSALSQQVSGSEGQDTIPNEQSSDHALSTLSSSRAMPQDPPIPKDIPSSPPESKIRHSPDLLSSSPETGSPLSTTDFTPSPATSITVASSPPLLEKKSADESSDTASHVEKPRQFSMNVIDPTVPSLKKGRVSPSVKSSSSSVHSERRPSSIASVARNTSRSFKRLVKGSAAAGGSKPQNGVSSPSVESLASTKGKERTPSIASAKRSNSGSWKLWKKGKNPNESVESLASVDHQPSPLVSGIHVPAVVGSEQAQAAPAVLVETNSQPRGPVPATAAEPDRASPLKKRFGLLGSKSSKANLRQAALKNAYEKGR